MARVHVYKVLINTDGSVLTGASVQVNDDAGGATSQTLYANEVGSTSLTNPFTSASGLVEFWLNNPERLSIVFTPSGGSPTTVVVDAAPAANQQIVDAGAPLSVSNAPTAGQVLIATSTTTAAWSDIPNLGAPNAQTNNYTLVLADANTVVEVSNAAAKTVTVPPHSSVAFAVGDVIEVDQMGAGQVTLAAGAGVTIHAQSGAMKLTGQYAACTLRCRATDEWVLVGSLTT